MWRAQPALQVHWLIGEIGTDITYSRTRRTLALSLPLVRSFR